MIHLHLHTMYSAGDALPAPADYAKAAPAGSSLAITDHNTLGGAVAHQKACQKHGVDPIFGVCLDLEDKTRLTLLAQNEGGFENLCVLIRHAPASYSDLARHNEGVIALSGDLKGALPQAALVEDLEEFKPKLRKLRAIFSDRFYLELIDHGLDEQKKVNQTLRKCAQFFDLKTVQTNDVHFLKEEDAYAHAALICDRMGKSLSKAPSPHLPDAHLTDIQSPVAEEIAERCSFELDVGVDPILPNFELPPGDGRTQRQFLFDKAKEGVEAKKVDVTDTYLERLEHEIEIVDRMGFVGYYLIVWHFIRYAREHGVPVGPGRGSGAGSLLAWGLGITSVDPIEHGLLFERFLNPERLSMPDFDIDFGMERREWVIEFVRDHYGSDCVAGISTYGELQSRSAFKSAARVLGYDPEYINDISKEHLPETTDDETLEEFVESTQGKKLLKSHSDLEEPFRLGAMLEGTYRDTSRHAGGVVISDRPMTHFGPTEEHDEDYLEHLLQYDMEDAESVGLVKFDFLGLKELTVMRRTREIGEDVPEEIPAGSKEAFDLICSGDTLGIFQSSKDGMTRALKRIQPRSHSDMTDAIALYRPGPLNSGMVDTYIDRKHGDEDVEYPHSDLEEVLKDTYGLMIYQEQVMQVAQTMAGYSLGEADILRRAVGKKKKKLMQTQKTKFLEGAVEQGYSQMLADEMWDKIKEFAEYGFNRSHSAAYAKISCQTAYLKAHHTAAYLAAQMDVRDDFDTVGAFIREAQKMAVDIWGPNVNRSKASFDVDDDGWIVFGLESLKGVGEESAECIEKEAPFDDLGQFLTAVEPNKGVLEALAYSGALDGFVPEDVDTMEGREAIVSQGQDYQKDLEAYFEQRAFLSPEEAGVTIDWGAADADTLEMLALEKEYIGWYRTKHPAEMLDSEGTTFLAERQSRRLKVRVVIEDVRTTWTKNDNEMAFIDISDPKDLITIPVFPDDFESVDLEVGAPVCMSIRKGDRGYVFNQIVEEGDDEDASSRQRRAR